MVINKTQELSEHKRKVAAVYNLTAPGYDKPALQFFPRVAQRLVDLSRIQNGSVVLDAGTGTGVAAFAAMEKVGRAGRVIGLDVSEQILEQARRKRDQKELTNLSFRLGDMEHLEFSGETFDAVLSASSIFFLPNMAAGLKEWKRVVKAGGCVAVAGYGESAFRPMSDLFEERIRSNRVKLAAPIRPFSWQRLTEPEQCLSLFREAGLENIEVFCEQLGYYLPDAEAWWDVVWNSGFRGPVSQLQADELLCLKSDHLAEVSKLMTPKGLWLDIAAIFAIGRKPRM